ncbi:hypothetical protein DsansV1_C42g0237811 [Dioscorea sansibarensis]
MVKLKEVILMIHWNRQKIELYLYVWEGLGAYDTIMYFGPLIVLRAPVNYFSSCQTLFG